MSGGHKIRVAAPAKVNLYLDVLGRREDGYHEIDTVMQTVSLADTITLREAPDGRLSLTVGGRAEGVPVGDDNLVMRAARLMASRTGRPAGATIHIDKRIPLGAGLGGGSSDAAATLVGLSDLWQLSLDEREIESMAAELGSDVPFFVRGGTARCRGRGEVVEPLCVNGVLRAVLVISEPLSTSEVYEECDRQPLTSRPGVDILSMIDRGIDLAGFAGRPVFNGLQAAAVRIRPEIGAVLDAVVSAGARLPSGAAVHAAVSGSGSCVFAAVPTTGDARALINGLDGAGCRGVQRALAVESVGPRRTARDGTGHGSGVVSGIP